MGLMLVPSLSSESRRLYSLGVGVCLVCICESPAPCWGLDTSDSSSSIELLLKDVGGHAEGYRGQDQGDLERVACIEQAQEVGLAGLVHQKYIPKTRPARMPRAMAKRACFMRCFRCGAGAHGWLGREQLGEQAAPVIPAIAFALTTTVVSPVQTFCIALMF